MPASSPGVESTSDGAETFLLRPAHVHAQKHFGPVLRFGAAGAGLDGDDGVEAVVFAGEQRFRFEVGDVGIGGGDFLGDIFEERVALRVVFLFFGEVEIGFDVAHLAIERVFGVDAVFELLALLQDGLGLFLVLPEIWRR